MTQVKAFWLYGNSDKTTFMNLLRTDSVLECLTEFGASEIKKIYDLQPKVVYVSESGVSTAISSLVQLLKNDPESIVSSYCGSLDDTVVVIVANEPPPAALDGLVCAVKFN